MGPLPMGFGLVHIVPRLVCEEPLASGGGRRWLLVHLYKTYRRVRANPQSLGEKDLVQGESVWRARLPVAPRAVAPRELKTEGGL